MYSRYKGLKEAGVEPGRAAGIVTLGYNSIDGGDNSLEAVGERLIGSYWPLAGGELVHQGIGNGNGAFGTGIGLKYNKALPKGINL